MARKKAMAFKFTRSSVDAAACPPDKAQAFFWDTEQPELGLRVTVGGAKAFVFESKLGRETVRITIGPASMQIRGTRDRKGKPLTPGADIEAARLAGLVAQGIDPRAQKAASIAEQQANREAARVERARLEVTGLDAWAVYCEDRRPHWGERYRADHEAMVAEGGAPHKRSKGGKTTRPGVLRALLARPLAELDTATIEAWVTRETAVRPRSASFGFGMLRAFLRWCGTHAEYRAIAHADACESRRTTEKLAPKVAKDDALQREQLRPWFSEVRKLPPVVSAYLQTVLLTGCRPGEALEMRWEDVDFRWASIRIKDKVEGERTIALTPYVAGLLRVLQARNSAPPTTPRRLRADPKAEAAYVREWEPSPWVFASPTAGGGHLTKANKAHERALTAAGLPHVSQHGLRRSFGSLSEWVECPVGIVAQIMGHKPSATAERHYRVRPIDLLRMWHSRIEQWILAEAGIEQPKAQESGERPVLAIVTGAGD